jgi:hypothetical protein
MLLNCFGRWRVSSAEKIWKSKSLFAVFVCDERRRRTGEGPHGQTAQKSATDLVGEEAKRVLDRDAVS